MNFASNANFYLLFINSCASGWVVYFVVPSALESPERGRSSRERPCFETELYSFVEQWNLVRFRGKQHGRKNKHENHHPASDHTGHFLFGCLCLWSVALVVRFMSDYCSQFMSKSSLLV
jgi:hypothetical protein